MQLLTNILVIAVVALSIFGAYFAGLVRGIERGLLEKNSLYARAYKEVLSISTEENKKRLDDMASAQIRINEAVADAQKEQRVAVVFEGKPQA